MRWGERKCADASEGERLSRVEAMDALDVEHRDRRCIWVCGRRMLQGVLCFGALSGHDDPRHVLLARCQPRCTQIRPRRCQGYFWTLAVPALVSQLSATSDSAISYSANPGRQLIEVKNQHSQMAACARETLFWWTSAAPAAWDGGTGRRIPSDLTG